MLAKGIGIFLSILLITIGVIITGPLKKHLELVREGNVRHPNSFIDFR